jgi:hypothetical protein
MKKNRAGEAAGVLGRDEGGGMEPTVRLELTTC